MSNLLLVIINTLLLGAENSIFHAERLHYGKVLFKKEDFDWFEKIDDFHKITDPLKIVLIPLIIIFSYLLIKRSFWLFAVSLVLNIPPINVITITVANIFVIPLTMLISKLRGAK